MHLHTKYLVLHKLNITPTRRHIIKPHLLVLMLQILQVVCFSNNGIFDWLANGRFTKEKKPGRWAIRGKAVRLEEKQSIRDNYANATPARRACRHLELKCRSQNELWIVRCPLAVAQFASKQPIKLNLPRAALFPEEMPIVCCVSCGSNGNISRKWRFSREERAPRSRNSRISLMTEATLQCNCLLFVNLVLFTPFIFFLLKILK